MLVSLFKENDWPFRQIVIRVCSISNFVHFSCFIYPHYFVVPHHIGLVIVYYSALFMTLLTGLGWGLNWNTILKKNAKSPDQLHLTNESNRSLNFN